MTIGNTPAFDSTGGGGKASKTAFGRTDRGPTGIADFFRTHKCNSLCKLLQLPRNVAYEPSAPSGECRAPERGGGLQLRRCSSHRPRRGAPFTNSEHRTRTRTPQLQRWTLHRPLPPLLPFQARARTRTRRARRASPRRWPPRSSPSSRRTTSRSGRSSESSRPGAAPPTRTSAARARGHPDPNTNLRHILALDTHWPSTPTHL